MNESCPVFLLSCVIITFLKDMRFCWAAVCHSSSQLQCDITYEKDRTVKIQRIEGQLNCSSALGQGKVWFSNPYIYPLTLQLYRATVRICIKQSNNVRLGRFTSHRKDLSAELRRRHLVLTSPFPFSFPLRKKFQSLTKLSTSLSLGVTHRLTTEALSKSCFRKYL